jgi:hypothetical protein
MSSPANGRTASWRIWRPGPISETPPRDGVSDPGSTRSCWGESHPPHSFRSPAAVATHGVERPVEAGQDVGRFFDLLKALESEPRLLGRGCCPGSTRCHWAKFRSRSLRSPAAVAAMARRIVRLSRCRYSEGYAALSSAVASSPACRRSGRCPSWPASAHAKVAMVRSMKRDRQAVSARVG